MVNSSTPVKAIIEESPADTPSDSVQKQNHEIQLGMEISEDSDRQAISYYIQNCEFVCMDSFNVRNNHIKNCGNNNYRRTMADDRILSNDEVPVPHTRPEEKISGSMPSTGPNLCSFPTNPLDHTQIHLNPNTLVPPQPITQAPVQNADPREIALSYPTETTYQPQLGPTNALQSVPSSSDSSPSDNTHHSLTCLEQYPDSSLANVVIIQLSGNTLADILTPPAYNAFKAHVASDVSISSTKRIVADPPADSSTSRLEVPNTPRRHILIPVHCVVFSLATLVVLSWLAFFHRS